VKNLWKTRLVEASAVTDVIGAGRAVLKFLTIFLSTLSAISFSLIVFSPILFHRSFFRPRL